MKMRATLASFLFSDCPSNLLFSWGEDGVCYCTFRAFLFFQARLVNNDEASAT